MLVFPLFVVGTPSSSGCQAKVAVSFLSCCVLPQGCASRWAKEQARDGTSEGACLNIIGGCCFETTRVIYQQAKREGNKKGMEGSGKKKHACRKETRRHGDVTCIHHNRKHNKATCLACLRATFVCVVLRQIQQN